VIQETVETGEGIPRVELKKEWVKKREREREETSVIENMREIVR
jgi:hypothetical protein